MKLIKNFKFVLFFFIYFCFISIINSSFQKINDELVVNFDAFQQSSDAYKREYGNISEDLDKMITRIIEDMNEVRARFNEKELELNAYNKIRDEYESIMQNITKIIELIETKTQQSRGTNLRQNLGLLKVRN